MHTEHKIKSKKRAGGTVPIVTDRENKRYRLRFFKRRRMHEHPSVPFGYIYWRYRGERRFTALLSMGEDLKFKHPFSCLVSCPSGSGKTFCIRFLQTLKCFFSEPNFRGGIIWCYTTVAPSTMDSCPGNNTFVFKKEFQQTLTTVGKNRA